MYFDFEDHRPDSPRVPHAISVREGVLVSIIFHLGLVILILMFPDVLARSEDPATLAAIAANQARQEPQRFVYIEPLNDVPRPPERPADASDLDRRAGAPERANEPTNLQPLMRGNTPEMVEGGPTAATPPSLPAPPADAASSVIDSNAGAPVDDRPSVQPPQPAVARGAGDAFRDLGRYLRSDRFDNPQGDFGAWLRRFKNQVERNWIIPASVMTFRGRVVVRFSVLRNGTIVDFQVLQPASVAALTTAAVNALKLSNPTAALPPEYPADRMQITVTFYYNEDPRSYR
jgi:TonB family protein